MRVYIFDVGTSITNQFKTNDRYASLVPQVLGLPLRHLPDGILTIMDIREEGGLRDLPGLFLTLLTGHIELVLEELVGVLSVHDLTLQHHDGLLLHQRHHVQEVAEDAIVVKILALVHVHQLVDLVVLAYDQPIREEEVLVRGLTGLLLRGTTLV